MIVLLKNNFTLGSYLFEIHFHKFIIILIIFIISFLSFFNCPKAILTNSHNVFTFWEPHGSLTGYLKACLKTWRKYLPADYKIIILDYSNIRYYLGPKLVKQILCKDMTLPIQADAIRVAILQKYGGFWMDDDVILVNHKWMKMFYGSDLIMFGNKKNNFQHIGFIYASNNSTILRKWLDIIIERVRIYKYRLLLKHIFPIKYFNDYYNQLRNWSYLGNGILDDLVKYAPEKDFKRIERDTSFVTPDQLLLNGLADKRYKEYYFTSKYKLPSLKKCKGVLILHNSWTPKQYKNMSEEEFLKQKVLLARLLSRILKRKK